MLDVVTFSYRNVIMLNNCITKQFKKTIYFIFKHPIIILYCMKISRFRLEKNETKMPRKINLELVSEIFMQ